MYIDKEEDRESGDYNFGVRQYDNRIGRFMAVDPLWEKFRAWSPYNYCGNNPLILRDPTGFGWTDDLVAALTAGYNQIARDLETGYNRMASDLEAGYNRMMTNLGAGYDRLSSGLNDMTTQLQDGAEKVSTAIEKVKNPDDKRQSTEPAEASKDNGNGNPFLGPVAAPVMIVDIVGNIIPVGAGQQIHGSPDGRFMQVKDAEGNPTGIRKDGPHGPAHKPEGKVPHAHRPDVPGTEYWLPVRPMPGQSVPAP